MAETNLRDAIAYITWKLGCIHPFRISRILVLANWKMLEKGRKPVTRFRVQGFEAGFYIEDMKEIIEEDECFKINEEKKCIEYNCRLPEIPGEVAEVFDRVLEETRNLGDRDLNRLVIGDPRYKELLEKGEFT